MKMSEAMRHLPDDKLVYFYSETIKAYFPHSSVAQAKENVETMNDLELVDYFIKNDDIYIKEFYAD